MRLKTEAALLGYESVALRDGQIALKLRRAVATDRVALYRKYRNASAPAWARCASPAATFAEEPDAWLGQLRELLPLVVGKAKAAASA